MTTKQQELVKDTPEHVLPPQRRTTGHGIFSQTTTPQLSGIYDGIERRRTIRLRRSALLHADMEQLDRPSIKLAENLDEYNQAFSVLHDVYLSAGYLKRQHPSGLHLNLHHLLPRTCVFVFKSYLNVLSTMSYIPDTPTFGLPLDELYKDELDALRDVGRKIIEIGSLATIRHRCGQNLMIFLAKAIFQYAALTEADDLCIMVNPKHVEFYKSIFLFKSFGEPRYYSKVDAMAVALRVDMHTIKSSLHQAYNTSDFDTNLHNFFVKINSHIIDSRMTRLQLEKDKPLNYEIFHLFIASHPELIHNLTSPQRACLEKIYGISIRHRK